VTKWKHEPRVSKVRGRYKFECVCGWQGGKYAEQADGMTAYREHTKLIEREERRKASEGA